jgi:branched-chain amino acid transport system permease protein
MSSTFKRIFGTSSAREPRNVTRPPGINQGQLLLVTLVLGCVGGLLLSLVSNDALLFVWYEAAVYALFAISTNIVVGWNGVGTFGQALYFGAGAYVVGMLHLHNINLPPEVLLLLAGCVAAFIAVFFGLLATRTGSYVAMAMLTLMFAQVGYQVLYGVAFFGGSDGITGIPRGKLFGLNLNGTTAFNWYLIAVITVCWYAIARFRRSTVAHAMFAVKDDPIRAQAAGLSVRGLQIFGFVVGGFFAGIAGGLFGQVEAVVTPNLAFWTTSGTVLMMVIIGGTRFVWGPALGAVLYSWVNYKLLGTTSAMDIYLGVALLIFVLFAPRGVSYLIVESFRKFTAILTRSRREVS